MNKALDHVVRAASKLSYECRVVVDTADLQIVSCSVGKENVELFFAFVDDFICVHSDPVMYVPGKKFSNACNICNSINNNIDFFRACVDLTVDLKGAIRLFYRYPATNNKVIDKMTCLLLTETEAAIKRICELCGLFLLHDAGIEN